MSKDYRSNLIKLLSRGILSCSLMFCATVALAEKSEEEKLPIADLQRFTKVIEYIKDYYVKPIDDEVLFENAIRGMLAGLDPHSSYFNKEEFAELKESTTGKFGGLGVEVFPEDGFIRVVSPIDDSPAQRAGVQAGDLIVRLNETPVKGLTMREAVELMRGDKGTKITLTIIRQGENKPLLIPVIRDTISAQSVKSKMIEDFAYLRVSQFQNNSGEDLTRAVQALKKSNGGKLKGLILDLRNNPGGVLNSAVEIADAFLDRDKLKDYDDVIVYAKGRLPGSQIKQKAHPGDLLNGAPIVVLVNGGSASGSEIVAGALQDYHRAVIVGTDSFGKGSVQTVMPLKDETGFKITTALYYTPAGRSIQATGIKPDIVVQNLRIPPPSEKDDLNSFLIREEDLQGHLENGNKETNKEKTIEKVKDKLTKDKLEKEKAPEKDKAQFSQLPSSPNALIYTDYQLHEALNILKGLTLGETTVVANVGSKS